MRNIFYVYLLACNDESLYCGYTNDLDKRVAAHGCGKGAKYTKSRLPVRLVYSERWGSKSEALRREAEIKNMTRKQKLALIKENTEL